MFSLIPDTLGGTFAASLAAPSALIMLDG